MKVSYYIAFLILILSSACKKKELGPIEYVQWVDNTDNGLRVEKEFSDYFLRLQYKPTDYVVLKEFGLEKSTNVDLFNKRKAELDSFLYFNLDISSKDKKESVLNNRLNNNREYYARLNYFTTFAQKDIKLIMSDDTIPCSLYHFERTYNLSPFNTIVLGFKQTVNTDISKSNIQVTFDDKILSIGRINFLIDKKKLKKIPKLAL